MKVVSTDNYGGDYPDEKFLCWVDSNGKSTHVQFYTKDTADLIAKQLQDIYGPTAPRFFKVVENDYVLQPGFEP